MPLTEKGEKIHSAMVEKYGKEKGEEVFYASKNKGTIKGVDAKDVGAESWVGGHSTGYSINTEADQMNMPPPQSSPIATPTNTSIAGVIPPGMATSANAPTNLVTGDRHRVAATHDDIARAGGRK